VTEPEAPVFAEAPPARLELGDGVVLERATPAHVTSAVASINESLEHLRPWMAWAQEPATAEAIGKVYADADAGWAARTEFTYVVVDAATGKVIGGSGLHGRLGPNGLEIGYWVHVDRIGRGLATEVARALTGAAFTIPGIERVRIQCADDNVRSARVPAKLGYRHVRTHVPDDGPCAEQPTQVWEVERATWDEATKS
jgi:RimJ/RimL family protein N-acetyltransferase